MDGMSTITTIIFLAIVLHLVVGIGWLVYKLSRKKGDEKGFYDHNPFE